ncbi:uncharacterized protein LX64_04581 [Chitinophaga skermanii]|uniref:HD domain-containing protein n=1 Tax=Chitinophaga skermanii TaxID=331697 RepID=A0A327Q6L7_9BACT|nr:HD domain-containing protein [Chitinophaga skermanii]RAI99447.1 uncharacterized protein LX64_04581 [Chitinophaga skermanii]
MIHEQIIDKTVAYVKQELHQAEGGHDWWHIQRVWNNAKHIAASEPSNLLVVELGALLHDIADAKFHNGDESIGPRKARAFMETLALDEPTIAAVIYIIENISYKGGHNNNVARTPELNVVQDADRLDAIGAIGIARAFNYGGFKNRALHDPTVQPNLQRTKEDYKHNNAPTIAHFYEKLLLLKDLMNTTKGKSMAEQRHAYMEGYLQQFFEEWEGIR